MGRIDRSNGQDKTMEQRHINAMLRNFDEYELVKNKKHPTYKTAGEFFEGKHICKQNFHKYYRRFINAGKNESALIPHKTGRKVKEVLQFNDEVIELIKQMRAKAYNKFDISKEIKRQKDIIISPSTIYRLRK